LTWAPWASINACMKKKKWNGKSARKRAAVDGWDFETSSSPGKSERKSGGTISSHQCKRTLCACNLCKKNSYRKGMVYQQASKRRCRHGGSVYRSPGHRHRSAELRCVHRASSRRSSRHKTNRVAHVAYINDAALFGAAADIIGCGHLSFLRRADMGYLRRCAHLTVCLIFNITGFRRRCFAA